MPFLPAVSNFLIADSVFQQNSGKWCVIGIFNRIFSPKYPSVHHSLGVFVALSDALGKYAVRVDFCDDKDNVITKFEGVGIEVKNRGVTVEFGIQTYGLPLPRPGKFIFKLFFNNELAHQAPLQLVLIENAGGKNA